MTEESSYSLSSTGMVIIIIMILDVILTFHRFAAIYCIAYIRIEYRMA